MTAQVEDSKRRHSIDLPLSMGRRKTGRIAQEKNGPIGLWGQRAPTRKICGDSQHERYGRRRMKDYPTAERTHSNGEPKWPQRLRT